MVCRIAALALLAGTLTGCGAPHAAPLAGACTADPGALIGVLAAAPRPVRLSDGDPLSSCIANGTDDGDLQDIGTAWSNAAEQLATTAGSDPVAAARLGYLIGAARRGAAHTAGVMTELVHRMEDIGGDVGDRANAAARQALESGLAAGEQTG